ncbi:MAG: hypothetical protein PUF79_05045 [Lactobacillaceae bacterium]|nr:hypothetical protein [Lactobacillaceae bacterium]
MNQGQTKRYQQAEKLIKQGKWGPAGDILDPLVTETADPAATRQLVRVLYKDHQYVQALSNVLDEPELFYQNEEFAGLAVKIMVQNQRFMLARLFVANGPMDWQQDLGTFIQDGEQITQTKYHQTIQQRLKTFYHLGDGNLMEQRQRLDEAYALPLDSFILGTKFVLRDPFVHYLIKADIIESLRKLGVDTQLDYLWIDDQEYQVNPAELPAQDDVPAVKTVRQIIQERLGDQDAISFQMANQQFDLQLMFLFPRAANVITDPTEWANVLLATLNGHEISDNTTAGRWQQRLMTLISTLAQAGK